MELQKSPGLIVESTELESKPLQRPVKIDVYLPGNIGNPKELSLLLINDGQDLVDMGFNKMIGYLWDQEYVKPLVIVGIHCGKDRKLEYGLASAVDFKGRGAKSGLYQEFIFEELLPYINSNYGIGTFKEKAFAGFSLGALSALDVVWNHPEVFSKAGAFSASFWWRGKDKNDKEFNETHDRLMHRQIRMGSFHPGLKFFFQCGELDETEDRNKNGVIDSIDDTIDLMRELANKGYLEGKDFQYLQLADGKHDVPTWAKALPAFLSWGWGKEVIGN